MFSRSDYTGLSLLLFHLSNVVPNVVPNDVPNVVPIDCMLCPPQDLLDMLLARGLLRWLCQETRFSQDAKCLATRRSCVHGSRCLRCLCIQGTQARAAKESPVLGIGSTKSLDIVAFDP